MSRSVFGFATMMLLAACAGAQDDDGLDLAESSEALTANCAGSNRYGVDNGDPNWIIKACNVNSSSALCSIPYMFQPSQLQTAIYPFTIGLGNGWSSGERSSLPSAASSAVSYMTGQLGGDCTNASGLPPFPFGVSGTSSSGAYMTLDKGALTEYVNPNNSGQGFEKFVHMACVSSTALSEPYPMSAARRCTQWRATVDYDKLYNWANPSCGSTCVNRALRNLFQKAFSIGMGNGLNTNFSSTVDANDIRRDINQTGWSGNQVAWVCNYAHNLDTSTTLTCI